MVGVPNDDTEHTVGGYVPVNANNHNGSGPLRYGVPPSRDRDLHPITFIDPDLIQVEIVVRPPPGSETIRLRVEHAGRARVRLWDTNKKENELAAQGTVEWAVGQQPAFFFVEGVLEGTAERDITLTLQLIDVFGLLVPDGEDVIKLTVTPILKELLAVKTQGAAPALEVRANGNELHLGSGSGAPAGKDAMNFRAKALRRNVAGKPKLAQVVRLLNRVVLLDGSFNGGALITPPGGGDPVSRYWDFDIPYTGEFLIDSRTEDEIPFYLEDENLAHDNPR